MFVLGNVSESDENYLSLKTINSNDFIEILTLPLNIPGSSLKGERTPANYNLCNKAHHSTLNTLISNFSIQPGLFLKKNEEKK